MKIFLVEDEVFALRILHKKITDLKQNYEIVGMATDGSEALPKILETKPAVVITDIRMSDMDGLTLVRKLQELHVCAIPVIISGYQEFEYAKQAMKLGVKDYLLKPVELTELEECLRRCREKLESEYNQKNIHSFLIGNESFHLESITSNDHFLLTYMIFSTPLSSSQTLLHPGTGQIYGTDVRRFFVENMPGYSLFCFDGVFSNEKVLLFNSSEKSMEQSARLLQELTPKLAAAFSFPVTAFYMESPANMLTCNIQTARRGCVQNAVLGKSGCYSCLLPVNISSDLSDFIELLALLLKQDDQELIHSNLSRIFKEWEAEERTVTTCQTDLVFILNSLKRSFFHSNTMDMDATFFVENILCFCSSFEELADDFSQFLIEFFSPHKKISESAASSIQLVEKMEDFFRQNISRSMTLQLLSDETNVSKVYLSKVFKKHKNSTPIDYFNHMKIQKACELLQQFSTLPLQEISERLGFNDVYYFSKVFKKIVGISPSAYRKKVMSQTEN